MNQLKDTVAALGQIRTEYGSAAKLRRLRLLRAAARHQICDAAVLVNYHEVLLFLSAFPDSELTLELASAELRRVCEAVKTLNALGRLRDLDKLEDSGIAGTITHCQFSSVTATWLAEHYPRDTEIAWEDGSAGSALETMLATLVEPVEMNGLDDVSISTRAWFKAARGNVASKRGSDLLWVLRHFARLKLEPHIRDKIFDLLELRIRWQLRKKSASRTFARFPRRKVHYQSTPLNRSVDVPGVMDQPLAKGSQRARRRALELIDIGRSVLAVRHRETDPLTFASAEDVALFDLNSGIDVALFGHAPGHRMPIETYYGYILAKNRVPIAYGGGWLFCGRCEIGINIFDTFRGGESMNTFAQLLRLYHHHFGVERFTVEQYQVGSDNPEGIRTAAFWFYYRFGFRSQDPDTERIAELEWTRMHEERGYRSSSRVLRRLAEHPLELVLERIERHRYFEPNELSLGVTHWIGERFLGERDSARRWSIRQVHRALGPIDQSRWRKAEIAAFDDFCLLVAPISDLSRWPSVDKLDLIQLMRAKGGARERTFAVRLKRHTRLREAWKIIADNGENCRGATSDA